MADERDPADTDIREAALRFSVDYSSDEETVNDVVGRAQVFYDWLKGKFDIPVSYEFEKDVPDPAPDDTDTKVVAMKPRKR